jgi:hypothetical protein
LNIRLVDPSPIELEPRPCDLCGLTVDRHEIVDDGEGPIFYCVDLSPDEMTLDELERRTELIRLVEVAEIMARMETSDPRDRWRHTGEPPPRPPAEPPRRREPFRPAESTVAAFWYVVGLADPEKFKAWIADHPKDARFLIKLLEGK